MSPSFAGYFNQDFEIYSKNPDTLNSCQKICAVKAKIDKDEFSYNLLKTFGIILS